MLQGHRVLTSLGAQNYVHSHANKHMLQPCDAVWEHRGGIEIIPLTQAWEEGLLVKNRSAYFHGELVSPACPVNRIPTGHTRMTRKTHQSEHTWVNKLASQSDSWNHNSTVRCTWDERCQLRLGAQHVKRSNHYPAVTVFFYLKAIRLCFRKDRKCVWKTARHLNWSALSECHQYAYSNINTVTHQYIVRAST